MSDMSPERLWAKSVPHGEKPTDSMYLAGHLADAHAAADKVLQATGDDQLSALGLEPDTFRDRFRRCVLLAAAVHDLGKANDHFQGMLRRASDRVDRPQGIRHEWVTVLMLQELKSWLMPTVTDESEFAFVEWAVSGHHPAHDHCSPPRNCPPGAGAELRLRTNEPDFTACLNWLGETFSLAGPVPRLVNTIWPLTGVGNPFSEIAVWFKAAQRRWDAMRKNAHYIKLLAAIKNCLIAADVAGSALPKEDPHNPNRWEWISQSFAEMPKPGDLDKVVSERSKTFQGTNSDQKLFQAAVRDSQKPVTFVKAGCGSGKTLAAYMWAAKNHPARRLFFCYPTTGTTTEGFRDYLHEPDVHADLFHSRRAVDFEMILGVDADSSTAATDAAVRIESLDVWSTPIVACTVDTVLGVVQNNKRGLFAWPGLAQSAFVFDEIHAYDDRLFGALLRFLRDLPGLPVLLMTASLPTPREEALRATLEQFRSLGLNIISGPESLETVPRYHRQPIEANDPLALVTARYEAGDEVLWVCNTVGRVMIWAERAEAIGLKPLLYHSRFKYEHRVQRHKAVIEAFKSQTAALAICSQVAEMSLDLSADLLVTDLAPVPALIQRLGRLNRRATAGSPTKPLVIIEPDTHLPYTPADVEAARTWLGRLPATEISQRHLSELWEQSAENPPDLVPSAWLDGGPTTNVTELREASPGITVLMCSDLDLLHKPSDLGRYTLPMPPPPRGLNWQSWPRHKGIPIAEDATIIYDDKRGAEWRKP